MLRMRADMCFRVSMNLHDYTKPDTLAYAGTDHPLLPLLDWFAVGPSRVIDALAAMYPELEFCNKAWGTKSTEWDGVYMSPEICTFHMLRREGLRMWNITSWFKRSNAEGCIPNSDGSESGCTDPFFVPKPKTSFPIVFTERPGDHLHAMAWTMAWTMTWTMTCLQH